MKANHLSLLLAFLLSLASLTAFAADDYDTRQAKRYTQETEYYQKKADGYRREAAYYTKRGTMRSRMRFEYDDGQLCRRRDESRVRFLQGRARRHPGKLMATFQTKRK